MRFRKLPVVIEASQWFKMGDHPAVVDGYRGLGGLHGPVPIIVTLEGVHQVIPGDWIITGVAGEVYPCKDDIFLRTYEPVDGYGGAAERFAFVVIDGTVPVPVLPHDFKTFRDGSTYCCKHCAMLVSDPMAFPGKCWARYPDQDRSQEPTCTWTMQAWDEAERWDTTCGETFVLEDGKPSDNSMKFCCYCGKPLVEVVSDRHALDEEDEE